MFDDGLDFAPRGPAITVCPLVWPRVIRTAALLTLIASPALYMGGRYVAQWLWGV